MEEPYRSFAQASPVEGRGSRRALWIATGALVLGAPM